MTIKLKKTGQEVYSMPWSGAGNSKQTWPKTHERVQRPFLPHEGGNSKNNAEILFVRKDNLAFS